MAVLGDIAKIIIAFIIFLIMLINFWFSLCSYFMFKPHKLAFTVNYSSQKIRSTFSTNHSSVFRKWQNWGQIRTPNYLSVNILNCNDWISSEINTVLTSLDENGKIFNSLKCSTMKIDDHCWTSGQLGALHLITQKPRAYTSIYQQPCSLRRLH